MEYKFPKQLIHFMSAQEPQKILPYDYYTSPWVDVYPETKFYPHCKKLIDIIQNTNWEAKEYGTFIENKKILCCELYTIKDWSMYKKANNHPTTEIFENIGCDVVPAFEPHRDFIESLMKWLPYDRYFRIHVNVLKPGGYLLPHMDKHPGEYTKGLGHKLMIPLNLPQGFRFKLWRAGDVPLEVGKVMSINTREYLHAVINDSNEDRYMLHVKGLPSDPVAYKNFLITK